MPLKEVGVELGWGPAKLSGKWVPDVAERDAAWELYVELVTRIAVAPLGRREGLLREALNSLYSLFGTTREVLRKYGPAVARAPEIGEYRLGHLAIWILNAVLRPVLARWHPELQRWESLRPTERSMADHEEAWERANELRDELERLRILLVQYARILALVCEAPALIDAIDEIIAARSFPTNGVPGESL
ncbi:hypothetical protein [Arthrobacter sp. 754]|uniref:hypothetical protein n=1 Tax=Arthrobacter sp. 754 TaxID=3156315 RepID=UPI003399A0A9